jgi:hypothetical protein
LLAEVADPDRLAGIGGQRRHRMPGQLGLLGFDGALRAPMLEIGAGADVRGAVDVAVPDDIHLEQRHPVERAHILRDKQRALGGRLEDPRGVDRRVAHRRLDRGSRQPEQRRGLVQAGKLLGTRPVGKAVHRRPELGLGIVLHSRLGCGRLALRGEQFMHRLERDGVAIERRLSDDPKAHPDIFIEVDLHRDDGALLR